MPLGKSRFESDMDEEFRFHLESRVESLMQAGMGGAEARRTALLEFGGMERTKEECRDTRWMRHIDELAQDLRYAARILIKSPGFTGAVVLTLALSVGLNSAIFSVVNAVLLRPLPYPEPDRLVYVKEDLEHVGVTPYTNGLDYLGWRDQSRSLTRIAGYEWSQANLSGGEGAERVDCGLATESFFPMLDVQPVIGRAFSPEEDRPGGAPVVILSNSLWKRRFGGDPGVLGRALSLDGKSYSIVGVLPAGFQVPDRYRSSYDLWTPFAINEANKRQARLTSMRVIARLKRGVDAEQARAELDAILQSKGGNRFRTRALVVPWHEEITGDVSLSLLVYLAAVGLVLLIACVNVANLLLARSATREHEIAIRHALGAGRLRIIRQLLTESILLALIGAAVGLVLAFWGKSLLLMLIADNLPTLAPIGIDMRVLGFTMALALLTGIAFGLAPALQASRIDLAGALKEGSRITTGAPARTRFRSLLVISQVTLALVLLIGAGLLLKSFLRVRGIDSGFRSDNTLTLKISLTPTKYLTPPEQARFFQKVVERIRGLTGVQVAALDSCLPLGGQSMLVTGVGIEGRPEESPENFERISVATVSSDLFRAVGIPLITGRNFAESDCAGAPGVAIVSESFVKRYFPSENPLGRRIKEPFRKDEWLTIVGMVGDVRQHGPYHEILPFIYESYLQAGTPFMSVVVRTAGDPMKLVAAVRGQIASVDKDEPPHNIMTLDQLVAASIGSRRSHMILVGVFAALAAMLAFIGIYGIVAYSVTQRTHEIGIRIALGAARRDVLLMIVGRGLLLVAAGEAFGLAGALALNKALSSMVFQITTTDAYTLATVALLWAVVAMVACYIPAHKATVIDPMLALRYE